jgi:hypothetical protein
MKLFFIIYFILSISAILAQENTEYKNQKKSSFTQENLASKDYLSFKIWRQESAIKDQTSDWEQAFNARKNKEIAGRFFQCVGTCHVERGAGFFNPHFRSSIYENDEIQTIGESYAWIYLFDGTMIRLSPDTSITINEFNVGQTENFISARINMGNVLWMSRLENFHTENNHRETDALFYPLKYYEATPTIDRPPYKEDNLILFTEENKTTLHQTERLNQLIEENNLLTNEKKTFAFLVLPNVTLMGINPVVEMVSLLEGKSYLRQRSFEDQELEVEPDDKQNELQYQLRGYNNKELINLEPGDWMEVDAKGKTIEKVLDLNLLHMGEFITKRIPSILVARELLMKEYSAFVFQQHYDRLALAKYNGYRLWDKTELDLRLNFLKEYFRRIETTNLLSAVHFREKMTARGFKTRPAEYSSIYFKKALEKLSAAEIYSEEQKTGEQLNSTTKKLWKMQNGIK